MQLFLRLSSFNKLFLISAFDSARAVLSPILLLLASKFLREEELKQRSHKYPYLILFKYEVKSFAITSGVSSVIWLSWRLIISMVWFLYSPSHKAINESPIRFHLFISRFFRVLFNHKDVINFWDVSPEKSFSDKINFLTGGYFTNFKF